MGSFTSLFQWRRRQEVPLLELPGSGLPPEAHWLATQHLELYSIAVHHADTDVRLNLIHKTI